MNTAQGAVAKTVAGARVIWLVDTAQDRAHWMLEKLAKRAGLLEMPLVLDVETLAAEDAEGFAGRVLDQGCRGTTVVALMGPDALALGLGASQQEPWVFRRVPHRWGLVVPLLGPRQLLHHRAEKEKEEEEEAANVETAEPEEQLPVYKRKKVSWLRENPPRFTGIQALRLSQLAGWAQTCVPYPTPALPAYVIDPPPAVFEAWVDEVLAIPDLLVAYDLETSYGLKQGGAEDDLGIDRDRLIIRMSFSVAERDGVTIPFTGPYLAATRRLLAGANPKVGHNSWKFDEPVLELNGYALGGEHYDTQDAWHLLYPDLPKGLEFISALLTDAQPWKQLAYTDAAALYAAIDADVTWQCWAELQRQLLAQGLWEVYCGEVETRQVLRRAARQGTCIDNAMRLQLGEEFRQELHQRLHAAQTLVAPEFRQEARYVRRPKDQPTAVERPGTRTVKTCSACGALNVNKRHRCKRPKGTPQPEWQVVLKEIPHTYWAVPCPPVEAGLDVLQRWLKRGNGFNPNSSSQLLDYMRAHKHPVGFNHKTEEDAADTIHLKKLAKKYGKKHPIYGMTLEIHKLAKALSTYIEGMVPDEHGVLHTTYTNGPWTWRLASQGPNLQNIPKRKGNDWAKRVRRMFVPRPGHVFVQVDSSAIEAVLVGYYMGDLGYIELAKQSIHAYVVCKRLNWPFTPENVRRVKEEQKALYEQVKKVSHGVAYGMGPYLLYMSDPENFPTLRAAQIAQEMLFDTFPALPRWQHEVRVRAQRESRLTSPWNVTAYFYDVFTWDYDEDGQLKSDPTTGLPKQKLGKDGKRAIAYLPQHGAGMFMRESIRLLGRSKWAQYMPAHVSVHDSICLDVPKELADEAREFLLTLLTRPVAELGGLCIGAEAEVGENWLDMEFVEARPMLGMNGSSLAKEEAA